MPLLPQGKNGEPLHLLISDNTVPLRLSQIEAVRWIGGLIVLSEERWVVAPHVGVCQVCGVFVGQWKKNDGLDLCVSRNVTGRPPMKKFLIRARWKQNGAMILATQKQIVRRRRTHPQMTAVEMHNWTGYILQLLHHCVPPPHPAHPTPSTLPPFRSLLNMNKSSLWQQMYAADTLLTSP